MDALPTNETATTATAATAAATAAADPAPRRHTDELLLPLLRARSEAEAERQLERLIREHADPVLAAVLRRRWRGGGAAAGVPGRRGGAFEPREEAEARDAYGDALVRIIARLRECRRDPERARISDFRAYVAVAAYRASDERLRRLYPARAALHDRLRYALAHHPGLATWREGAAAAAAARGPAPRQGRVGDALPLCPRALLGGRVDEDAPPGELLAALFAAAGGPLPLGDATAIVSEYTNLREARPAPGPRGEGAPPDAVAESLRDPAADVAGAVERRLYLERLWGEVLALPAPQRAALLLNLCCSPGRGVLPLLPLCGVATLPRIAEALDMAPGALAALWNDLPLEDAAIARRLGVTRQQVINLRMSARRRLARRMAASERDG